MAGQGTYTFKKGDNFDKVAKDWSFKSAKPIWDDPGNAALKKKRKTPDKLEPGDKVFMPFTDKMKKDITTKKEHYRDLIDGELALMGLMNGRAAQFASAAAIASSRIKSLTEARQELEDSLKGVAKDIKKTSFVVDTINDVLTVVKGLAKTSAKAAKATGAELKKLNKEAMKQITGIPADKAKKAAKGAGVKYLLDEKNEISAVGITVGVLSDSFDKMTSPSFWATTISRMRTSGKGVSWESWVDAVNYDLEQDITNKLHMADRTFLPAKKAAERDFQAAEKAAKECIRLSEAAADRIKIHRKKFDKLPSW